MDGSLSRWNSHAGSEDLAMTEVLDRLRAAKEKADKDGIVRRQYLAYVDDRTKCGGWSSSDVEEYREEVRRIMSEGTDDEKLAAREFWASEYLIDGSDENSVNARIRKQIEESK